MASPSKNSASPIGSTSTNYLSEDSDNGGFVDVSTMSSENLEKSLTNLNVNIALLASQNEGIASTFKDFLVNFMKQQEMVAEETKLLRVEMMKLRNATKRGV